MFQYIFCKSSDLLNETFLFLLVYKKKNNRKMKKDNLIDFVDSISKKIIEKVELNKEKMSKSIIKIQQNESNSASQRIALNKSQKNTSSDKSNKTLQKQASKAIQNIEFDQTIENRKQTSKSSIDKTKQNSTSPRQLKQKLLKMSNAKMSQDQIRNQRKQPTHSKKSQKSNKSQHSYQHQLINKQNIPKYQSPVSLTAPIHTIHTIHTLHSKIQLNNAQPLINSRLLSKQQKQLKQQIQFTDQQIQRLKIYFKHYCQLVKNYPKSSTFQNVSNILKSFNMTQWMIFCKNLKVTDRFRSGNKEGLKILSCLFKKYQNSEYRITYDRFQILVSEVILDIVEHQMKKINHKSISEEELQKDKKQRINEVIDWLHLNDSKKQRLKLKQMGVMCSQQIFYLPKYAQRSQRKEKSYNTSKHQARLQRPSMPILESTAPSPCQKHRLPKLYKNFKQKKQSKLMHSLAVTNLHEFVPTDETKHELEKYIGIDDRYLKQYFKKHDQVKSGVLKSLENGFEKNTGRSVGRGLGKSVFGK